MPRQRGGGAVDGLPDRGAEESRERLISNRSVSELADMGALKKL